MPSVVDGRAHVSAGAIASICRNGAAFTSKHDALRAVEVAAQEAGASWLAFFYVDWSGGDIPAAPTAAALEEASGGVRYSSSASHGIGPSCQKALLSR